MTVEAQPVSELPDPRSLGFTVVAEDELPAELTALVDRVRTLIDAVAHTEAPAADLAAARRLVEDAVRRVDGERRPVGALVQRTEFEGPVGYGTVTNIVEGPTNPAAPPLRLEQAEQGVRAEVTLGGVYQGPPGLVHGGWIAAMLDQALGSASAAAGMPGLTANLTVDYRRPTPLDVPLEISARVTGTERRKVFVSAEIRHNGEVTAEGTAIMVQVALPG
ncbi:acyl-coenzyme A thioesterase PaaI-like protein [Nocardiopsis mwathae]|uniref:Acyl-coenzyme A thioesterase THEM4 n=1 Tax=Nocardiopsis mwathae TaxID=1472723 RepID=A0A7X0D6T1_9ACTN|nr:PaaI family thioesterase [Nocardiopsis mwathae]MBB6172429.1 acyl-coenzyme A thioesterase PaaI-like protein [Nocardiopsis mwathae]